MSHTKDNQCLHMKELTRDLQCHHNLIDSISICWTEYGFGDIEYEIYLHLTDIRTNSEVITIEFDGCVELSDIYNTLICVAHNKYYTKCIQLIDLQCNIRIDEDTGQTYVTLYLPTFLNLDGAFIRMYTDIRAKLRSFTTNSKCELHNNAVIDLLYYSRYSVIFFINNMKWKTYSLYNSKKINKIIVRSNFDVTSATILNTANNMINFVYDYTLYKYDNNYSIFTSYYNDDNVRVMDVRDIYINEILYINQPDIAIYLVSDTNQDYQYISSSS